MSSGKQRDKQFYENRLEKKFPVFFTETAASVTLLPFISNIA